MRKLEVILGDAKFIISDTINIHREHTLGVNTPHFHVDTEVHIVFSGSSTMQIDDNSVTLREGDVCLISPSLYHYYKKYTDDFRKEAFAFSLFKNHDYKKRKNFSEYSFYNSILNSKNNVVIVNDKLLLDTAKQIFLLDPSESTEHIHQTLYSFFLITMSKLVEEQKQSAIQNNDKNGYSVSDGYEQKRITEDFFQSRYNQNVTIEDLAKELYRSVPQTHRIVKYHYHSSFRQILIKQRIEYACMLIDEGALNLNQISLECGYNTYNGFLAAFKKHTGKTPEEYKNLRNHTGNITDGVIH